MSATLAAFLIVGAIFFVLFFMEIKNGNDQLIGSQPYRRQVVRGTPAEWDDTAEMGEADGAGESNHSATTDIRARRAGL